MSMFTLVISCLTTSNLPWFMDLTFQVPIQYCFLHLWTFLLSPVPSTTGCCFCFGSIPSFFLELFLQWFSVTYWTPTDLGSSSLSVLSFCLFILFMGCWIRLLRVPWTARCREPVRDIPLVTKVMRKEARHTQRRDWASGVPPDILEHLPPKNQSLPTLLLCALTSDFTGGCPPPPSHSLCQRVNLQLQLIKFLGN